MNVKSVFTRLFPKQRPHGMVIIFLFFLVNSSFTEHPDRELMAKQANIMIRKIGHHLLWQAGDSTSRVLPVTQMNTGTFLLRFDNEFVFNPDSMMALTKRLLTASDFPSGFTLTVHDCNNKSIVYGFQVNRTVPDILSCKGRIHPAGCYLVEFTFPDFHEKSREGAIANKPVTGSLLSIPFTANADTILVVNSAALPSKRESSTTSLSVKKGRDDRFFEVNATKLVFAGALILVMIALISPYFRKSAPLAQVENEINPVTKEFLPASPALGAYLFDVRGRRLLLGNDVTTLTDKECKVLELLHQNFDELVPRETLLEEVWIKEGVITGRSLDMFVSKLRKKLSGDPGLSITNVHGKGYRLTTTQLT
jgi:hypothetical protein